MLTDKEVGIALTRTTGERVTKGQIESRISWHFARVGPTVTVCNIIVDNGFSVRGESACVDPVNYNQEIGEKLAYDDAFRKLWPLFGFLLAEQRLIRALDQSNPGDPSPETGPFAK